MTDHDDQFFFRQAIIGISPEISITFSDDGTALKEQLDDVTRPAPDIIFLDLKMPYMDGVQTLGEIKSNVRSSHIPVVIFTTSPEVENIALTYSLGASRYMIKPSNFPTLRKFIRRLVEQPVLPVSSLWEFLISDI